MSEPNDSDLPESASTSRGSDGVLAVPDFLAELLALSRSQYDWPEGTGAARSQERVIELESKAGEWVAGLSAPTAHALIREVSIWGGNKARAQTDIDRASPETKVLMAAAIQSVMKADELAIGLDRLSELPGLRLVMATKVFRFCCPDVGAAVDRHASYFFNSLNVLTAENGSRRKAVAFRREWANGKHTKSRLAIYNPGNHRKNRDEFVFRYLPLVTEIAGVLNKMGVTFNCAATQETKSWRPVDVEMAAYYWWARHGLR